MTLKNKGSLLLFGCDYYPDKRHHETNFWNDILKYFAEHFYRVVILSVNNRPMKEEKLHPNVYLYNIKPSFYSRVNEQSDPEYSGEKFNKFPMSILYKTITLLKAAPLIDQLIEAHDVKIFHYFKVFGMLNSRLINRYPKMIFSVTVPTHVDRGFPLHYLYHFIKYGTLKKMTKVIVTSIATEKRLRKLNVIDEDKLLTIHWSLEQPDAHFSYEDILNLRARYNIQKNENLILWSGPLQGTKWEDFIYALDIANGVVNKSDKYKFIFAFKPDKLKSNERKMLPHSDNIRFMETDKAKFNDICSIADMFLSPICKTNRTVAPPLTWIEMMQMGIPIITTKVDGSELLVINNKTGIKIQNCQDAVESIINITNDEICILKDNAMKISKMEYNLKKIAAEYIKLWNSCMTQR